MSDTGRVRIDKWLWAARFFKTRSLAAAAVGSGKVRCNGAHVKPARDLKCGDELDINNGDVRFVVVVEALSDKRGPASVARQLYAETPESSARRAAEQELRRLAPVPGADLKGRPTKRQGRLLRGMND